MILETDKGLEFEVQYLPWEDKESIIEFFGDQKIVSDLSCLRAQVTGYDKTNHTQEEQVEIETYLRDFVYEVEQEIISRL